MNEYADFIKEKLDTVLNEMQEYSWLFVNYMHWGIETSFRELKYAIGLINFHSKKADYIMQ